MKLNFVANFLGILRNIFLCFTSLKVKVARIQIQFSRKARVMTPNVEEYDWAMSRSESADQHRALGGQQICTSNIVKNKQVEASHINEIVSVFNIKVSKGAKIRNQYNQVRHLTTDANRKVTNTHLDTTNESQEVSPFPFRPF